MIRGRGFWMASVMAVVLPFFTGLNQAVSQSFPAGFERQLITGAITKATAMAIANDGRIFITQQTGQLRIVKNGVLLTTPFVGVTVDDIGERGLIGVALDPMFSLNGYVYVYYTAPGTPAHNRISRFTANGDVAVPGSEVIIRDLDPLGAANIHNGGAMIFGADGKLYVGVGDNSDGNKAQDPETHMGKILRLNPDGSAPPDNPNAGGSTHAALIWAMGVRNPYAFSKDPLTGRIFVIDVGANAFEEINDITPGGRNFGWPNAEGNSLNPAYTNPVYTYSHGTGDGVGCAITGGTFFAPLATNYPATYYGMYFFMDFCGKWINTIDLSVSPVMSAPFGTNVANVPLYLSTGIDGNLYYLSRSASLFRLVYTGLSPPTILGHPQNLSTTAGEAATFSVHAIGANPLSYQWNKDGAAIPGATSPEMVITATMAADQGSYTVTVSNSDGSVTSNPATLDVEIITGLVSRERNGYVSLYPVPARAGTPAVLWCRAENQGTLLVAISDAVGKHVFRQHYLIEAGDNRVALPSENLPEGLYLVAVETAGVRHLLKLIIAR